MIKNNLEMRPSRQRLLNVTLHALTGFGQLVLHMTMALWQGWEILVWCSGWVRGVFLKIKANPRLPQDLSRPATVARPAAGEEQG
jgi:hypothetical protein